MRVPEGVLHWLLEPTNPPVRYLTLVDLLDRPEANPEVRSTRARLMEYSVTREILTHSRALAPLGPAASSASAVVLVLDTPSRHLLL